MTGPRGGVHYVNEAFETGGELGWRLLSPVSYNPAILPQQCDLVSSERYWQKRESRQRKSVTFPIHLHLVAVGPARARQTLGKKQLTHFRHLVIYSYRYGQEQHRA